MPPSWAPPDINIIPGESCDWQICLNNSVLNVKAVSAAFNQKKALVGAFSVIVKPVVEPVEHYTALTSS